MCPDSKLPALDSDRLLSHLTGPTPKQEAPDMAPQNP